MIRSQLQKALDDKNIKGDPEMFFLVKEEILYSDTEKSNTEERKLPIEKLIYRPITNEICLTNHED